MVLTFNNANGVQNVYINGVFQSTVSGCYFGNIGNGTHSRPIIVGAEILHDDGSFTNIFPQGPFKGNVDDIYVFDRELTATDVTLLYQL